MTEVLESPTAEAERLRALRRMAIVPAFNEEGSIAGVVGELLAYDPGLRVVVVDDGSTDRTAEVARGRR